MERRRLGRTNLMVSIVGLGGIPLQRRTKEEVKEIIEKCHEVGINFIDTARGYTVSEELIGQAIENTRDRWILATKSMARDYKGMKEDIEISLSNLKTDYIDLYQIHLVKTREMYEEIMSNDGAYKALLEAKDEGKIGYIGITGHNSELLEEIIEDNKFDTVQFPYNPVETQGERLFERAKELDMGVIVMKPIAGGAFHPGELSLKFILNNKNVTSAIPGMDKIEEVKINASVGKNLTPLEKEELELIEKKAADLGTEFCRRCGYCGPCPQGIDIPTQFVLEGYLLRYELQDWARSRYKTLAKKADDCIECGACEPKCPYNLPIRNMLKRVKNNFANV